MERRKRPQGKAKWGESKCKSRVAKEMGKTGRGKKPSRKDGKWKGNTGKNNKNNGGVLKDPEKILEENSKEGRKSQSKKI